MQPCRNGKLPPLPLRSYSRQRKGEGSLADLHAQLAILRAKIATMEQRTFQPATPRPSQPKITQALEDMLDGWSQAGEVETPLGKHFECERLYPAYRRHGNVDIGSLASLPTNLLSSLADEGFPQCDPGRWAFLDTETTGLAGGSGTYAFLVGVGRITSDGFRVKQFFMRDFSEEASMLDALTRHLADFEVLITYNGRAYDQPLLETRYRMSRARPPFSKLAHLDLLFGARRLWKLCFDSCRLVELEYQILGVEREGDIPGSLIPYVYFEYVRMGHSPRLGPVFEHNALDIVTLACLTAIVPRAFQSEGWDMLPARHPAEWVGLGRWLRQAGQLDQATRLFRKALTSGLADELTWRTMWDLAGLERKLEKPDSALALYAELAGADNPFRPAACEELAKHYEHKERNPAMAMEFVLIAMEVEVNPGLVKRKARLEAKMHKPRSLRLL